MVGQRRPNDDELEFAALMREQRGYLQQMRMRELGDRLRRGRALAVLSATFGFCGDRLKLLLADGTVLKLKLFAPAVRPSLIALCAVDWRDGLGWTAVGQSVGGDRIVVRGWDPEVSFAGRERLTATTD